MVYDHITFYRGYFYYFGRRIYLERNIERNGNTNFMGYWQAVFENANKTSITKRQFTQNTYYKQLFNRIYTAQNN